MAVRHRNLWDKVGACASAVCAVHCLLTGVALGLLSTLGLGFFGSPVVDGFFILVAVAVGAIALWHGIRRHHSYAPAMFYVIGISAILVSRGRHLIEGEFVHRHSLVDTVLSVAGGLCFVLFHVLNLRMQHIHERGQCGCCQIKPGR